MNARCKINISEQSVDVVISRGRNELQVFIDDVEQDETKEICKFQHSKRKRCRIRLFLFICTFVFFLSSRIRTQSKVHTEADGEDFY